MGVFVAFPLKERKKRKRGWKESGNVQIKKERKKERVGITYLKRKKEKRKEGIYEER